MSEQVVSTFRLTRGEELWLWRKRRGQSIAAAAAELGMGRGSYMAAERDGGIESQPPLSPSPNQNEVMRLLRRRSRAGSRALARALGVSHVTWLKFERSSPPDPRLCAFWISFDWSAGVYNPSSA